MERFFFFVWKHSCIESRHLSLASLLLFWLHNLIPAWGKKEQKIGKRSINSKHHFDADLEIKGWFSAYFALSGRNLYRNVYKILSEMKESAFTVCWFTPNLRDSYKIILLRFYGSILVLSFLFLVNGLGEKLQDSIKHPIRATTTSRDKHWGGGGGSA